MVLTLGRSKIDENTFHNDIRPWEFSQSPLNTWFMKRICMQYYRIIFKTWYPRVHFASKRRKLNADFSKFMTNLGPFSWLRFWKISEHSKFNKKRNFWKSSNKKCLTSFLICLPHLKPDVLESRIWTALHGILSDYEPVQDPQVFDWNLVHCGPKIVE